VRDAWVLRSRRLGIEPRTYALFRGRADRFTDRGRTIDIYDSRSGEAVLAALQLSAQKWGTISVHGNDDFLRPAPRECHPCRRAAGE
jgi:hypothetical protein